MSQPQKISLESEIIEDDDRTLTENSSSVKPSPNVEILPLIEEPVLNQPDNDEESKGAQSSKPPLKDLSPPEEGKKQDADSQQIISSQDVLLEESAGLADLKSA